MTAEPETAVRAGRHGSARYTTRGYQRSRHGHTVIVSLYSER